jgi:hypothetical protein
MVSLLFAEGGLKVKRHGSSQFHVWSMRRLQLTGVFEIGVRAIVEKEMEETEETSCHAES